MAEEKTRQVTCNRVNCKSRGIYPVCSFSFPDQYCNILKRKAVLDSLRRYAPTIPREEFA